MLFCNRDIFSTDYTFKVVFWLLGENIQLVIFLLLFLFYLYFIFTLLKLIERESLSKGR